MDKAEQILEKHINENDLNFIFHEKKDLWQELLNAVNEALCQPPVVGRSEQLCPKCGGGDLFDIDDHYTKCRDCGFSFVGA